VRPVRAVLLDALGTLVRLEPPVPRLQRELRSRLGLELDADEVERALATEIAFYREHHLEGRDSAATAALRARCTEVLRAALGPPAHQVPAAQLQEALLAALSFSPFPEVPGALEGLRAAGMRLVVVSNWDCSLHDVLADCGVAGHVDGILTSAQVGAAKPARAIFHHALTVAAVAAVDAVHVGDSPVEDVEGARGAGIEAVLIDREGKTAAPAGVRTVRSLGELADLAA